MRRYSTHPKWTAAFLLAALFLTGCAAGMNQVASTDVNVIEGSVWYRERMLLPPEAEVRITLEDISRMDVKSELIAETRFTPKGGPPFSFTLSYDPAKINDKSRYALRARILVDKQLMFTSTDHNPAFHDNADQPIEILVKRVKSNA
jgi:putative lipoprotein